MPGASGVFRVLHKDCAGFRTFFQQGCYLSRIDRLAIRNRKHLRANAIGLAELDPTLAKFSRTHDQCLVTGAEKIDNGSLHHTTARRGEKQYITLAVVEIPQTVQDFLKNAPKFVSAVVKQGLRHSRLDLRQQLCWAWSKQSFFKHASDSPSP